MTTLEVAGRRLAVTNVDKVLWPVAAFTKGELIDYYVRAAPALLPHLADRHLSLRRFPDGVDGGTWYQNECRGAPSWLRTEVVRDQRFCVVEDLAGLVWVANLAAIELHPFLARVDAPDEPTALLFDLDPGPHADLAACARVALRVRDLLDGAGLAAYPKTSGSVGLHVLVPLAPGHTFAETKAFARTVAGILAAETPELVVSEQRRSLRGSRVLVDWLQNDPTRSLVCAWSLRAAGWPTVATPVGWDEVERCASSGRAELLTFTWDAALDRLDRLGDLHAPVLAGGQRLPPA